MIVFPLPIDKLSRMLPRLALATLFCTLAAGCDAQTSDKVASKEPEKSLPVNAEVIARGGTGALRECLGRLVFEIPQALEWPSYFNPDAYDPFYAVFGKYGRSDSANIINIGNAQGMRDNNLRVVRWGPGAKDLEDSLRERHQLLGEAKLSGYRHGLANVERRVRELSADAAADAGTKQAIEDDRKDIAKVKERIAKFDGQWRPLDTGLPNSFGFQEGDRLVAYIRQDDYLLAIDSLAVEADEGQPAETSESHEKRFLNALRNFRARAVNEIPAEPGICVPGGFFRDDGTTPIKVKQDFRFADAPRVFYSIATGTVDPKRGPEATGFTAAANALALAGQVGKNLGTRSLLSRQAIGPGTVNIGDLKGQQGGVALTLRQDTCDVLDTRENNCKPEEYPDPFEMYSVFTGYSGRQGNEASPFILVQLYTVSPLEAPQLGPNPPPYAKSKARLDALLGSIRIIEPSRSVTTID